MPGLQFPRHREQGFDAALTIVISVWRALEIFLRESPGSVKTDRGPHYAQHECGEKTDPHAEDPASVAADRNSDKDEDLSHVMRTIQRVAGFVFRSAAAV